MMTRFTFEQYGLRRPWLVILLFLVGQFIALSAAQATHFRYGNLTWRQLPSDASGRTIEFKLTMGFRLGYFTPTPTVGSTVTNTSANSGAAFNYGDGTSISVFDFTVTTVNAADDYLYGEATLTHTFSTTGNVTAFIESSARLNSLQNNAGGRYRITSLVNVGSNNANLPPSSTLPPIVNLPVSQSAATFTVPATDPDGNPLTFSLATAADLGATSYTFTQPTGFSISAAGVATLDTRSPKAVNQLYNAIIKISDGKSFVVIDFLIKIVAASDPPVFVYGGITPANNSTIQTYVGCPINFTVRATDTDPTSNTITLQGVGLPAGAAFSPVTGSNTVTSAFSFTPTTEGTSVTSFFAQDNVGNQVITSVTFRVLQPMLTSRAPAVCVGNAISLTATPGTSASGVTTYTFRGPSGVIGSPGTSSTATVNGLTAGVYTFSVTTANSINSSSACTSTATTSVTVDAPPTVTLSNSGTLTCLVTSNTLTAASSTSGTSYAFSGPGLSQTSAANTAVVTQAGTYTVVVTTASGCTAVATTTVFSNTATPVAPTATVTAQPSCTLATGTITVSAPTGSGLTYSLDGATYTNTTGVFTGVAAGSYSVTVRNTASGCVSPVTSVTVNAQPPVPAAPTASVTSQPTCTTPTGTITITAPTGTGLTYSIDGSTYVGTTVFSGVAPGSYAVTVRNSSGCISAATTVTVNPALLASAAPTATVTAQPTCTLATGTITITAPTGLNFSYSIDGVNYTNTSGIFTGVVPGVYSVTDRNTIGCISTATSVTVTAQPPTPAAPSVSLLQPSCTLATGTISVTAPTGTGLTYSINGTTYTNTTGIFSGVAPGSYSVTVRTSSGCTSAPTAVTVNPQPPTPVAPTATVTAQPSCTLATGTITITAPTGSGLTYSIDGTTYTNTTGVFTGVPPGSYSVTVRNGSGCLSPATSVTVNAQPATPSAPTVSVSSQPSCTLATGTITITAPTGAGLTYSIDGTNYTNTTGIYTGVPPGSYSVTVRTSSGCTSAATSVTVTAQPATPPAPTATVTAQPNCTLTTGTITVTAPTGTGLTYSINGTTYTNTTGIFSGVAPGSYSVTVRTSSGCTSAPTAVTVNPQPPTPVAPTATVTAQPNCTLATGTISVSAPTGTGLTYSIDGATYTNTTGLFSGVTPGVYAVTVRNASGCTSPSTSVTVNVQPSTPTLTLNSATLCAGQSVTLTVTGCSGGTLQWSTGSTASSIMITPLVTTRYSVTCLAASGCSATTSQTVVVRPTPAYTQQPTVTLATCRGGTANQDASISFTTLQNTERADLLAASSYTGGPAYGAVSNRLVSGGAVSFSGLANPVSSQAYTVRLFSAGGLCTVDVPLTLLSTDCRCSGCPNIRLQMGK
ncbi:beta strand repeat-containing protein [Fibrella arboris]|uniref:beta strand repeat-containing protein n=1 Tax=Fibrella arboris TaxID=3242486 RepID=UPI0035200716